MWLCLSSFSHVHPGSWPRAARAGQCPALEVRGVSLPLLISKTEARCPKKPLVGFLWNQAPQVLSTAYVCQPNGGEDLPESSREEFRHLIPPNGLRQHWKAMRKNNLAALVSLGLNESKSSLACWAAARQQVTFCSQNFPTNWFLTPFPVALYKQRAAAGGRRRKLGCQKAPGADMALPGGLDLQRGTSHRGRASVTTVDGNHLVFVFDKVLRSKEICKTHRKYCSMSAL